MDNAKGAGSPYPPTDSENWNQNPLWEFDGNSLDGTLNGQLLMVDGVTKANVKFETATRDQHENINVSGEQLKN